MDVQAGHRRDGSITEEEVDPLVALLVGDHRLPLEARGVRARAKDPRARAGHRPPELPKLTHRVRSRRVNVGDQLDLARMQLALHLTLKLGKPLEHRRRAVRLTARDRIDQKQLLLDP